VLVIRTLPGGPAEDAGLQAGDILLSLGGVRIGPGVTLTDALFQHAPGDAVSIEVRRGDESLQVDVTLAERPGDL
jgi:S1-C subfamily serine protease